MASSVRTHSCLAFAAISWGLTFPLIERAVRHVPPSEFVFWRFLLASLILLPFIAKRLSKTTRWVLLGGGVLGLLNSGIFIFQSIGLETISASRAAFITGSSVLLVPFLGPLFGMGRVHLKDVALALLCLLGLYILTGAQLASLRIGDLWVLACALCVALSLVFIQKLAHHKISYQLLTFYQIILTMPLAGLTLTHSTLAILHGEALIALLFCALIGTALSLFLQMYGQQHTTAAKTALIFTLEPVSASIFAWLINGEAITWQVVIGGIVILSSIVLAELWPKKTAP